MKHHMTPYNPIFRDRFYELSNLLRIDISKLTTIRSNEKVIMNYKPQQPKKLNEGVTK